MKLRRLKRKKPEPREHHCHAIGCPIEVPPEMLMCKKHWFMVPKAIRNAVWKTYRPGQCDDMRPSEEWFEAAKMAIEAVARKEHKAKIEDDGEFDPDSPWLGTDFDMGDK